MGVIDIIVILIVIVWLAIAVRHIVKRRGACSGDCANCPRGCKKK